MKPSTTRLEMHAILFCDTTFVGASRTRKRKAHRSHLMHIKAKRSLILCMIGAARYAHCSTTKLYGSSFPLRHS
jgi:hypothetical protein